MVKIEEMAEEYVFSHAENVEEVKKDPYRNIIAKIAMQCYIDGANAVLKEIGNILSLEYNTMATVDLIVEKVKELKGE